MKVEEVVTERILEKLRQGVVPWRRSWKGAANAVTKKEYRGINAVLLSTSSYGSRYWLTYKQAAFQGGSVRSGERGLPVVYWHMIDKTEHGKRVLDDDGDPVKVPLLRYSTVFNIEQTDGVKAPKEESVDLGLPLDRAKDVAARCPCPILTQGSQPGYSASLDRIEMPELAAFQTPANYYHVLFHEMTHATGHESRLKRSLSTYKGSGSYAKEELIAEIGAAFLANRCDILDDAALEDSASYLDGWMKALRDDAGLILSASGKAQKAVDFLFGDVAAPSTAVAV